MTEDPEQWASSINSAVFSQTLLDLYSSVHPEQGMPAEPQNSLNRPQFHTSWLDQIRSLTSPVARLMECIGWPDFSHTLPPPDLGLWSASLEPHGFLKKIGSSLGRDRMDAKQANIRSWLRWHHPESECNLTMFLQVWSVWGRRQSSSDQAASWIDVPFWT